MSIKNTELVDIPTVSLDLFLNYGDAIRKYKRLKIGCYPKNCQLEELMFIQDILCKQPCYVSDRDIDNLEQRLIRISNG